MDNYQAKYTPKVSSKQRCAFTVLSPMNIVKPSAKPKNSIGPSSLVHTKEPTPPMMLKRYETVINGLQNVLDILMMCPVGVTPFSPREVI